MATMQTACRVCAGDLSLRVAGTNGHAPVAEAFAPSLPRDRPPRRPAARASSAAPSSSRCCRRGDELHDLYRDMRDDAYLGEEAGPARDRAPPARPDRRATSRAGACSTSAAGTGCCSTRRARAATRRSGSSCRRVGRAPRPRGARPRRARAAAGGLRGRRRLAGLRRRRARRRARAPRRPGRRDRPLRARCCAPAACCASSRRTRRRATARARRARAGGAIVPAHTVPAAAPHAARAARRRAAWSSPTDVPLVRTFAARRWVGGPGRAPRARRAGRSSALRRARCPPAPR